MPQENFVFSKIKLIFAVLGFSFFFLASAHIVQASGNVVGWAWSETAGWISFNCSNQASCSSVDYGVNIDESSGFFSGFAWSENLGWIRFDPPPDVSTGQYPTAPMHIVKLTGNQVKGWARACVGTVNNDCISATKPGAWDGWIKTEGPTYGVTSSGCLLSGYAWGGDIGWIKFRGTTQNGMEYGVSNSLCPDPPPMVSGLSASLNFCAPAPNVSFSWIYTDSMGENEKKFEFQVDNNSDFSSPEINRTLDNLDYVSPAANNQSVLLTSANESDKLTYNGGAFYWRVRVWDAEDNNTPHTNFSEPSLWVVASSVFNLPFHAYPDVHFVWAPLNPGINQETQFLDESRVFGGSSLAYRLWTFPLDSFITDKTTADLDPKIKFISCGNMPVSLRIDDSTGYSCTLNQTVVVKTAHCWQP